MAGLTNQMTFALRTPDTNTNFVSRINVLVDNIQAKKASIDQFCVFTLLLNGNSTYSLQTDNQALWKVVNDGSVDAVQDNPSNPSQACQFTFVPADTKLSKYVLKSALPGGGYIQVQANEDLFATADSTASATQFEIIPLKLPLSAP